MSVLDGTRRRAMFKDRTQALVRRTQYVRQNPAMSAGLLLILTLVVVSVGAPILGTIDPNQIDPFNRLKPPSLQNWFGTDHIGRDIYSRVLYGGQVSLFVGLVVAAVSMLAGTLLGLIAGYLRPADHLIMRVMDGLMAIPGILIAIALMSVSRASITNVIFAIALPEIPRVTRIVRGVVLSLREQTFIEAATAVGTRFVGMLSRHILPNTIPPMLVQATYVCGSAIIVEAALSFLGAGTPTDTPSWGAIMAEGKNYIRSGIWMLFFPGVFLTATVLAINLVGDGLRDRLDPRLRGIAK